MRSMLFGRRTGASVVAGLALAGCGVLAGCSPAFNWRDTRIDSHPLVMLLPCKADRGQREVPVGDQTRMLHMVGCNVGERTFAVSAVRLQEPGAAPMALVGWQRAAVQAWGMDAALGPVQALTAFAPQGALSLPASQRGRWQRSSPDPLRVDAGWFARADSQGVALYHAVVLSPGRRPPDAAAEDAIETFFASLRFE
jgi:hypothetical protein